jgi:hypothetical protein
VNPIKALLVAALMTAGPLSGTAAADIFTVSTTADSGPGSLRQAIEDANALSGFDDIHFDIAGTGVQTIAPGTDLPAVTDPVNIDGYTQPGSSPNTNSVGALNSVLMIEIAGTPEVATGLSITAGSSVVTGLAIRGFSGANVLLASGSSNLVGGNYIGTSAAGAESAGGDGDGVLVLSSSNQVGSVASTSMRNLISGNGLYGVNIEDGANNRVEANLIGTDREGTSDLGNVLSGVLARDATGATIARNVISGNGGDGVELSSASDTNVAGNSIGTSANGQADLGNAANGVSDFGGQDNVVGGGTAAARNVIAGNDNFGVFSLGNSVRPRVVGNFVGVDSTGGAALGNASAGVVLFGGDGAVGGTTAGARNVISGNGGPGVLIDGTGHRVQQNFIGTGADGITGLANGGDGVILRGAANLVGGATTRARNVVAGNGGDGVDVNGTAALVPTQLSFVQGNHVGLDAAGVALPNAGNGVRVGAGAVDVTVGGVTATSGAPPGNVISGNDESGVLVEGASTTGAAVEGNLIGTNRLGTAAVPNAMDGITLQDGASGVDIGGPGKRNVISGNELSGVFILGAGTTANRVDDNYVGVNAASTAAIPNATGVEIADGASGNFVGQPGGGRTVISGNRYEGVFIHGAATRRNVVQDAYVGVRVGGATAQGNETGVQISGGAQLNTVGGADTTLRNVISGNRGTGVAIAGRETNRNVVRGNYVGTAFDGNNAVPNPVGVDVSDGARSNTIGGALNSPRSVISGNTIAGVRVRDAGTLGTRVQGNLIGLRQDGVTGRPNGVGVQVSDGARDTKVGGPVAANANWIAFSSAAGVLVEGPSTRGVDVNRNRIFRNTGLGINLKPPGEGVEQTTANDPDDPDTGPNAVQNFPLISLATGDSGGLFVSGSLNSRPSTTYRIDVYRNPAGTTAAASEAEHHVGTTTVTTNSGGDASWSLSVPTSHGGEVLRATATNIATFETSELSPPVTAG